MSDVNRQPPVAQKTRLEVSRIARSILEVALFAATFFILQRLTFSLRFPPYERTTIWVPGALTFSVLFLTQTKQWWKYYLGVCGGAAAAYYGDSQIHALLALVAGQFHFAAVAICVLVIRRFMVDLPFSSVNDLLVFVPAAGFIVPLATAAPVELARWATGAENFVPTAIRSVLCVSLGLLIASPAFTTAFLHGREWIRWSSWQGKLEAAVITICLIAVGQWVFTSPAGTGTLPALIYAPIPILLWAALRFEVAGASWMLLIIAYQSTWNAINHRGPFVSGTADDYVLQLQLFLLAVSLPLLFTAAGVRERRRAYQQLLAEVDERRRMEDRFRLVVESTPNAMLMLNREGNIVLANKQSERLFGYLPEELLGKSVDQLLPERFRAELTSYLQASLDQCETPPVDSVAELFAMRSDGSEFPVQIGLTPLESASGTLLLAAIVDITERKRADQAHKEMVHASRLAMLSEFTASIAHEINQPLGAILSNADAAEMLLNSPTPPLDEVREILTDIRNDDLRASDVIRKLRGLLRRGEFDPQPLEINSIVADVMVIVRAETRRRGVEMQGELAEPLPLVLGDRVHLQQVLLNLMINAMEAMSETKGSRRLTISTGQNEGMVQVSVSDTGPGILPDDLPQLFDRFFSTKNEGMGMGLAISRTLIEEHGGRIWAENAAGQGATFWVSLPAQSSTPQTAPFFPSNSRSPLDD